jgi:hypothetical protein
VGGYVDGADGSAVAIAQYGLGPIKAWTVTPGGELPGVRSVWPLKEEMEGGHDDDDRYGASLRGSHGIYMRHRVIMRGYRLCGLMYVAPSHTEGASFRV